MPWFLFKAHVIFLIFQNICNKSLELKKKKKGNKSSCLGKITEKKIMRVANLKQ